MTRSFIFQVDQDSGDVLVVYRQEHMHICIDLDAEAFGEFAGMVNGALGDSKMAAS